MVQDEQRMSPLKRARVARNLTLQQVAEQTGLDVATLSRLERGKQWPTKKTRVLTEFFPSLSFDELADPFGEMDEGSGGE